MRGVLRESSTRFALVAAPSPTSLDDASYLFRGLLERDVLPAGVVFNQVAAGARVSAAPLAPRLLEARLKPLVRTSDLARHIAEELCALRARALRIEEEEAARIRVFLADLPDAVKVAKLPLVDRDIQDLPGLEELVTSFDAR